MVEESDLVDVGHDTDAEAHGVRPPVRGEISAGLSAPRSTLVNVRSGRLVSLDAFRGLTIAAMVLVNNPGTWAAVHPPLRHAAWHGWTATDLVFPFFLFIVGVAIPLSLEQRAPAPALVRVLRRASVIFVLGLVLNGAAGGDWAAIRIPGVLQRIAVCYLAGAVLFLLTGWRAQAAVAVALLLGYWGAMTLVPVPGYGAGDLGPQGNLAAWIDRAVLGPHLWRASPGYDPEGILSTAPAVATVLFGVLTGQWIRTGRAPRTLALGMLLTGALAVAAGAEWGHWFPVNKTLWTSSYAVLTGGLALLTFAACYWAVDVCGWRRWARPFVVLGVNALALYFLSSLAALALARVPAGGPSLQALVFERLFAPWATPVNASLAYAAAYLLVWWGPMWLLDRAGIRLRA
jgi:predicted acyltransferase